MTRAQKRANKLKYHGERTQIMGWLRKMPQLGLSSMITFPE